MQIAHFPLFKYEFIGRSHSIFKKNVDSCKTLKIFFSEILLSIYCTAIGYSQELILIWPDICNRI